MLVSQRQKKTKLQHEIWQWPLAIGRKLTTTFTIITHTWIYLSSIAIKAKFHLYLERRESFGLNERLREPELTYKV